MSYTKGNMTADRDNISIIETESSLVGGLSVEIFEYKEMRGVTNTSIAQASWFMNKANMRARQIALYLDGSGVMIEPGAMSYTQGNIDMVSGVTAGNILGRAISGALTGEKLAVPTYKGRGAVVLEPSFKFFCCFNMDDGEHVIVDKGLFYVAQDTVLVKPILNRTISSALLGGEGFFQTELVGPGLVVFELPVPKEEIQVIELHNETLKVDGNFALLRSGDIKFTVERSARSLIGSAISGEGLVNVFRGSGQVWLAPTIKIYNAIELALAMGGNIQNVDMNTSGSTKLNVKAGKN